MGVYSSSSRNKEFDPIKIKPILLVSISLMCDFVGDS